MRSSAAWASEESAARTGRARASTRGDLLVSLMGGRWTERSRVLCGDDHLFPVAFFVTQVKPRTHPGSFSLPDGDDDVGEVGKGRLRVEPRRAGRVVRMGVGDAPITSSPCSRARRSASR